jgi:hypothetical protein
LKFNVELQVLVEHIEMSVKSELVRRSVSKGSFVQAPLAFEIAIPRMLQLPSSSFNVSILHDEHELNLVETKYIPSRFGDTRNNTDDNGWLFIRRYPSLVSISKSGDRDPPASIHADAV